MAPGACCEVELETIGAQFTIGARSRRGARRHPHADNQVDGNAAEHLHDLLRTRRKNLVSQTHNHTSDSHQQLSDKPGMVQQHKTDVSSYNENNAFGAVLPLYDYNINKDLAELEAPTEYKDENPEDSED